MTRTRSSVTLKQLAQELGITPSAVSMALSDHPRISAKTKREVAQLATRRGYVPNSAGRALRGNKTGSIALIVPNTSQHVFGHPYFMSVLNGVTAEANRRDVNVVISTNPDSIDGAPAYERVLRSGSVDGGLVTSAALDAPHINRLIDSRLPVVFIGHAPQHPTRSSFGIDDLVGGQLAVEHILDHGVASALHLSGPLNHLSARLRAEACQSACQQRGVECEIAEGDFSEESGFKLTGRLIHQGRLPFESIVAANDEMAFGAMQALRAAQISVPEQVRLIGYDDFGLSRVTTPAISTVRVDAEGIAAAATDHLFEQISGNHTLHHENRTPSLVLRESCGCHQ